MAALQPSFCIQDMHTVVTQGNRHFLNHPGGEWTLLCVRSFGVLVLITKFSGLTEISWFSYDNELLIIFTLLLQPVSFRLVYFRIPLC